MYYYSGAIVKVPEIGNVTIQLIWLHDYKTDIILDKIVSSDEDGQTYIYHIDDDFFEKYTNGPYYEDEIVKSEPVEWKGISPTKWRPTQWHHGINIKQLLMNEPVEKAPSKLISIVESIITQPQLKAEDITKELSFLKYDLTYRPIKLSASKGWKAKRITDDEIVTFDSFIFDLLYVLKGRPEEH